MSPPRGYAMYKVCSIREFKTPTMGRARWVRRLNREIIDNFLLRTEEDVIHREIIDNFLLRTEEDVIQNIHPSLKSDT